MFYQPVPNSQQSLQIPVSGAEAAASAWQLSGQRALSLCSAQAGALRMVRGRLWATQTRAQVPSSFKCLDLASRDTEDVVLQPGEKLQMAARQKVVVEAFGGRAGEAVLFQWEPLGDSQHQNQLPASSSPQHRPHGNPQ